MAKRNLRKTLFILVSIVLLLIVGEIIIYENSKVQHIKAVQRVYDLGLKLMQEGKYLEAIEQLGDIDREDTEIYKTAQLKIKEAKERYINDRFIMANSAIQQDKLLKAVKYMEEVLVVDKENKEASLLKAKVNMKFQEELMPYINKPQRTPIQEINMEITPKYAVDLVKSLMQDNNNPDIKWGYEMIRYKDNVKYHVVYSYKSAGNYSVTLGWYYVDASTAKAFEWNRQDDKLMPIN